MSFKKDNEISVSVLKILNWTDAENSVKFEVSFFSKASGEHIISKQCNGIRDRETKSIALNFSFKIRYPEEQSTVILRLSYRMGFGGQIILADFPINLSNLILKKQLKLPFGKTKNQFLIVEEYRRKSKLSEKTSFHDYGLMTVQKSRNEEFIKQKQEFLERHSNRSDSNSARSTSNNVFTSRVSDLLTEVKNIRVNKEQQGLQNSKQNKQFNSTNETFRNISQNKGQQRKINYSERKGLQRAGQSLNRQKSQNNSSRSNHNSYLKKCILYVNNLNIVPCEQYYDKQTKYISQKLNAEKFQYNENYNRERNIKTTRQKAYNQNQEVISYQRMQRNEIKNKWKKELNAINSQYY